jgi:hypothetical protein
VLEARLVFRGFIRKPRKQCIYSILSVLSENVFDLCLDNYKLISKPYILNLE